MITDFVNKDVRGARLTPTQWTEESSFNLVGN